MVATGRKLRSGSVREELVNKSREAALAAVQIFNNPTIIFKSEIYVVLMHIAWTYLMHAHFRSQGVEHRYRADRSQANGGKKYARTKSGAYKRWELERCLNSSDSPIDQNTANNLRFLIGLRHEIEHQMTTRIDDFLSARFQACCLNYNHYIKELFGNRYGIDRDLTFSLQFSSISDEQVDLLGKAVDLPNHIKSYIDEFDDGLTEEEFNNPNFAYRILFVPKTANRKGQADKVIEFIRADSNLADNINAEYTVIKETERPKTRPSLIVESMRSEGFRRFNMHHHTTLWKSMDARNPGKGYGINVAGMWYWYERWVDVVRKHCKENHNIYK